MGFWFLLLAGLGLYTAGVATGAFVCGLTRTPIINDAECERADVLRFESTEARRYYPRIYVER